MGTRPVSVGKCGWVAGCIRKWGLLNFSAPWTSLYLPFTMFIWKNALKSMEKVYMVF